MPNGVPRIPQPREWLLTKFCVGCGERKPWARFSPGGYNEDGSVRRVTTYCHDCQAKTVWKRQEEWRRQNQEHIQAYKRDWSRRQKKTMRASKTSYGEFLPKGPFVAWLNDRAAELGGVMAVAECVGVDEKALRRVRDEQETVGTVLADRCFTALGWHLDEVYENWHELEAA